MSSREILFKDILNIPNKYSIDYYIAKDKFVSYGNLNSTDKEIFKDFVRQIQWCYRFRDDEIGIEPYFTDEKRYGEVEIINIILKDENLFKSPMEDKFFNQDGKIDRLIKIVFKLIRFPQLLIVQYRSYIRLYVSHVSVNMVDSSKRTIDEIISTKWIDTKNINDIEYTLFNNIQFDKFSYENMYEFYNGFVEEIIKYNGSLTSGSKVDLSTDRIKEINDEIEELNKEIKQFKSKLKGESQKRLERKYNKEIQVRRRRLKALEEELKGI